MDSSPISHNWLAFSLSNHPLNHINNNTPTGTGEAEKRQIGGDCGGATDLSIFKDNKNNSPKLEDFLGGSTTTTKTEPPPLNNNNNTPSQTQLFHFSTQTPPPPPATTTSVVSVSDIVNFHDENGDMIYDSELKKIAASFLRGFSNDPNGNGIRKHQPQYQVVQLPLVPSEPAAPKKSVDTFGQRTSIYRGVTRHRWTGRYEAHLWDNSCRREGQSRKGRQVYLGGYDKEEKAARAYDLAALKYWGPTTTTNFSVSDYEKELEEMKHMTRQEFVASLRRKSSGFSRGASIYRGVTRHHQHGRWQARIGRVAGNKDLYLGTFSTQEEAAEAYDIAAIKFRGLNAVTNFDMSRYDIKSIASSNLPIGGISGNKSRNISELVSDSNKTMDDKDPSSVSTVTFASQPLPNSTLTFGVPIKQDATDYWSILGFQNPTTTSSSTTSSISKSNNNSSTIAMSTLFQTTTNGCTTGYNMDHQHHVNVDLSMKESNNINNNNVVMLFNNGYVQQGSGGGSVSNDATRRSSSSSIMPITMPITLNSNGTSFEGSAGYGSWIGQSLHSLQAAKPNLSMFQTPIFGME